MRASDIIKCTNCLHLKVNNQWNAKCIAEIPHKEQETLRFFFSSKFFVFEFFFSLDACYTRPLMNRIISLLSPISKTCHPYKKYIYSNSKRNPLRMIRNRTIWSVPHLTFCNRTIFSQLHFRCSVAIKKESYLIPNLEFVLWLPCSFYFYSK